MSHILSTPSMPHFGASILSTPPRHHWFNMSARAVLDRIHVGTHEPHPMCTRRSANYLEAVRLCRQMDHL